MGVGLESNHASREVGLLSVGYAKISHFTLLIIMSGKVRKTTISLFLVLSVGCIAGP